LAGAGNIFHHHDWINAKQQRKRSRQLSECFGIDLVPRRSERMGNPLGSVRGPPSCLEISPNRKAGIGQGAGGTPHANGETASTTSPPMRAVLLKRLKRLAEKFESPNVGPRTAVRLPQRAACGYRKTGVSLRLTWRCRLRSLEIESRLNIGSVAVNALHPQMRARPSTILRI